MNHSENAYRFESNNNKIAVVTNGTAIDTMEYSVKTYMEAIAEVYKSAGLDIFGIELNTRNLLEIKTASCLFSRISGQY